ncbi:class I SAM-dependent methyltransferase [Bryobacter aggregatus]|uniref:class I SAM-dependent methyltransferase n=1 Tax=Bryobacter aggregatus TaxID=360054 RepID=UPI00068E7623|nr:class I SAM-dependent methyltransferase [Bryobacter aggregatus]
MKTVDYGIDKPERVRAFAMVATILIATGLSQFLALRSSVEIWPELILSFCLWVGILIYVLAGVMLWSSKSGKFGLAWRMLEEMKWIGKEKVLDVGCGRGLLTILAARKVPLGDVTGVDIWSQEELSENSKEAAVENARLEQVSERIQFEDGDVRALGFRSHSFDKIVSSLCLHAIASRNDRNQAIANLIKLLKPGGEIAILDILHTREYKVLFEKQGLKNIRRSPMKFLYCLPTRYVIAYKPLMEQ